MSDDLSDFEGEIKGLEPADYDAARKAIARECISLADYGELCSMLLDDDEAVERYLASKTTA